MAFKAKLLDATKTSDGWRLSVEFTNGAKVVVKKFNFNGLTNGQLKDFIRGAAVRLGAFRSSDYSALVGKSIDLAISAPSQTAEDIALASWLADLKKLKTLIARVNLGLLDGGDSQISTLQTSLISDYLSSYDEYI